MEASSVGDAPTVAEVVFTTNMSGYQEVFTDPSYRGQIVVMTAPMIGNYGINTEDPESSQPQVAGVIVRELSRTYSNWRADGRSRSAGSRRPKSQFSKKLIRVASRAT